MMLPPSLALVSVGLALVAVGLAAFLWAWREGQFERMDDQARVIFEARDYRFDRPWESPDQRAERKEQYGSPMHPDPGEWGGAE